MATAVQPDRFPKWMTFPMSSMAGGMAWLFVHPIDTVKTRINTCNPRSKDNFFTFGAKLVKAEGLGHLFSGMGAGQARQVVYTTLRLGFYDVARDNIARDTKHVTMPERIASGVVSGGAAAFCSCPVEIALVRMQNKPGQFKNLADCFMSIGRTGGGVTAYWQGSAPLVTRAAVVGVTQVAFYDQSKTFLKSFNQLSTWQAENLAGVATGFFYSFVTMPIETVKIRSMLKLLPPESKGQLSAMVHIARVEGITGLWAGYFPYFLRCFTHTYLCFLFLERIKKSANAAYDEKP